MKYLESGLQPGVEAHLLVKKGREREFESSETEVGSYGQKIKYFSWLFSRKLKKLNPDVVVIVCKGGFAHHHIARALKQYGKRYGFHWRTMFSVDGAPAEDLEPGMDEGGMFSDEAEAPWWVLATVVALWAAIAVGACFLGGFYGLLGVTVITALAEAGLHIVPEAGFRAVSGEDSLADLKVERKGVLRVDDSELGWRSADNAKVEVYYHLEGRAGCLRFEVNTDGRGRRLTSKDPGQFASKPEIVVIGGSQSFGWGVNDEDVFAWHLQTHFPDYQVNNYSIPRTSLYQQLLQLDRIFTTGQPRLVVLCLSSAVENWNTGELKDMASLHGLARPACLSKNKRLQRFVPTTYKYIPLSGSVRLLKLLEVGYNRVRFAGRSGVEAKLRTMEHLLLQIRHTCEKNGSELLVACTNDCSRYHGFLKKSGFSWELAGIDYSDDSLTLKPFDSHPNADGQKHFYRVIAAACEDMLSGKVVEPDIAKSLARGPVANRGEVEDIYPLF